MLIDVVFFQSVELGAILGNIAKINGNSSDVGRIQTGVYEVGHFSANYLLDGYNYERYPEIDDCYGVCDSYKQVLEHIPELHSSDKQYIVTLTPICKSMVIEVK